MHGSCTRVAQRFGMGLVVVLAPSPVVASGGGPLPRQLIQPWRTPTECQVTHQLVPQAGGFDVVYTIRNSTDHDVALPALVIDGIELGDDVEWLDLATGSALRMEQGPGGSASTRCYEYPGQVPAPAVVARNRHAAVGFSLLYPVLEYRHTVTSCLSRPVTGSVWFHTVVLDGMIAPGAERTYTVTARSTAPEKWTDTLRPYRDYFHGKYGVEPRYGHGPRRTASTRSPAARPGWAARRDCLIELHRPAT